MALIERVKHHQKAILFTTALLVVSGVLLTLSMPVGLFPDITFPRIVVNVNNGEQPADQVLVQITKPLESVVNAVPGIRLVRSVTSRGSVEMNVFLDWGTNVVQTMELLQGELGNIRSQLPPTARISVQMMNVSVVPIEGYSLTSSTVSQVQLHDLALYTIRPALLQVPGLARVNVTGGDIREFWVTVDPAKLAFYHLDIRQIDDAIEKANMVASTGLVENNYQLYLSLVDGLLKNTDDISNVTVTTFNGVPVHVGDLARVAPAVEEQYVRTTAGGKPAVLLDIFKQPTGSTVQIGLAAKQKLASIKLPPGIHIGNYYDQSGFIRRSILSTRDAILIGILLPMLVLFGFLRSWRTTLVLAIVVPATIACTFIFLDAIGQTINIMTLGGIAAAIALIIDDSIIIIEDIFTHFGPEHTSNSQFAFVSSARRSLRALMPAIIGSTASTIVIHIPLGFLGGLTGAFFRPLSITMVFALLLSFLFSITLAPLLASLLVRTKDIHREVQREQKPGRIFRIYKSWMDVLLRFRWASIVVVVAILGVTYLMYRQVGSEFMPEMDEGGFEIEYASPPGTSLNETNRMLESVGKILRATPEVESYSRRTGSKLSFILSEANTGDILVKLNSNRSRETEDVMNAIRDSVAHVQPALHVEFEQVLEDVIDELANSPKPIEIKLFSENVALRDTTAARIARAIAPVRGVADLFNGIVISGPSLIFTVDPSKASYYGLTTSDVQAQLETIMEGTVQSSVQMPEKLVGIRVQFPHSYRTDLDSISHLTLTGANGVPVPIAAIARITRTSGQPELDREGFRSYVAVTARLENRDLGSTMADIQKKIAGIHIPAGIQVQYGGVYETEQRSFQSLAVVAMIALLLVALVLLIEFREISVVISVLLVTLCSTIGAMFALWVTDTTINIASIVGMILIIGIAGEKAIFIMHWSKQPELARLGTKNALLEAARRRARPILMTSIAAILALLPLAIGFGNGAKMQQPLAIAIIGGFLVDSVLLVFLLPMLYLLLHGEQAPISELSLEVGA